MHIAHLTVEVILGIAYQVYGVAVGAENFFQYLVAVFGKVAPLFEIRSAEFVAKHTECGIRQQPRCVAVYKCLVFFRFESLFALLRIYFAQVFCLEIICTFVVDCCKGVELLCGGLEIVAACSISQFSEFGNTEIHGVKRKCRVCIIGIRVCPSMGHRRIVDW